MVTLGGERLTLLDIVKRMDPDGMPAEIAQLLQESNPIIEDIPYVEGNLPTGNQSTIQVGLPSVSLRRLNAGTASSKSVTAQITDGASIIEAWSTTDEEVLRISGNTAATRFQESQAFIEAMGQKKSELVFYGSEADDETEFNGLSVRYDTLGEANNVLDCSGSTASQQSSVWLVGWGVGKVYGIYPKGTMAGLRHKDWGLRPVVVGQTAASSVGSMMSAYQDQFTWHCGLVVKDWRYVVRIANVEENVAQTVAGDQAISAFGTMLLYNMGRALRMIPNLSACKPVFYMNRGLAQSLDVMALAQAQNQLTLTNFDGKMVTSFRGVPVKIADQLLYTEEIVTT
jgi:hypothetical protein